jgi:DNA (cytosine-5)-methyltransferase 1
MNEATKLMRPQYTLAEYFAGIGLVGLGLHPNWNVAFANDIDPKKYAMYAGYFGETPHYIVDDIFNLAPEQIPNTDLATASFPCIDLSLAGNREGLNGKHSGAFWGFVKILENLRSSRPPLIMLENVLGWLTAHQGHDFFEAIQALNALGYTCDVFVLNAHHFTPQSRPRLFIIGALDHPALSKGQLLSNLQRRSPHLLNDRLLSLLIEHHKLKWMTLDLPTPPSLDKTFSDIAEQLEEDDDQWWSVEKSNYIWQQMAPAHQAKLQSLQTRSSYYYATAYRRVRQGQVRVEVRTDGLAGCLRTPVGGSSKQIVIAVGKGRIRSRWMTSREYARLQGVPDDFPLRVPYLQALWGFGDAVCVPAIRWIGDNALTPLAKHLELGLFTPAGNG